MDSHVAFNLPFVGILLILAVLVLFGATWLFHHHHWKPVIGGLLFVIGVAFLVMFGWVGMRFSATPVANFAPRSVDREPLDRSSAVSDETVPAEMNEVRADAGRSAQHPVSARETVLAAPVAGSSSPANSNSDAGKTVTTPSTGDPQPADAGARPAWVDWPLGLKQAGKGFEATAASGLYSTRGECRRAILQPVNDLATEYVSENVPEAGEQGLALDRDYIWSKLVKAEYWETVDKAFGAETHPMSQLHVLLAFDSQVGRDLDDQAHQALVGSRLKDAAGVTACSLALLGGVYLLLKRGTSPRTPHAEHAS
jgi:hypothetical protein